MGHAMKKNKATLPKTKQALLAFVLHLLQRLGHDRLTVSAGNMAYVTLLSLVPLIYVLLSALSMVPMFADVGDQLKSVLLENLVPASSDVLETYLNKFVANAGKMTAIGVVFLFVVALMLISAIDQNLNYIWRTNKKRPLVFSFSIYWMVLTLGPVLVGTSLVVSSYLSSLPFLQVEGHKLFAPLLLRGLPFVLTTLAFLGLYTVVPNKKVELKHAAVGAICAGLLFECGKKLFALYVVTFPSYELIYGALAVVPVLFIWVYLSWCIVLFGAEVTATLGEEASWHPEILEQQMMVPPSEVSPPNPQLTDQTKPTGEGKS